MTTKRPTLRYHGGKWLLAPWIISHFPSHRIYVEPFGGGASVLMRKKPCYCDVYNDLDGELVNLFSVLRDDGVRLREALYNTPFSRDEFLLSYEISNDPLEQARRTVVRSFMGFGSNSHCQKTGFRSNSNRSGTTPARDWANYPDAMDAMIKRLRGVVIENRDASEVMLAHDTEKTLHYVDPPYMPETRDAGKDYRYEMTEAGHVELLDTIKSLSGYVILSGYENDIYNNALSDWHIVHKDSFADGARKRTEVLWISKNAIKQPSLFGRCAA